MNTEPSSTEAAFFGALERSGAGERAAFLDRACAGDAALRRHVERLLDAHARAERFMDRPVVKASCVSAAIGEVDVEGPAPAGADLSFLAPAGRPDALGRLDHYEVLDVVGSGATGVVLRARDTKLERVVAIKALAVQLAASGPARRRFAREARAAAAVRHDNVIGIHAVSDDGPVPYLVMEFVAGRNVEALVRDAGPVDVREVLRVGAQTANGLAAAHEQGLVHRDVKPANILLENGDGRVKLTDFGLARAADDASVTQHGCIAGTPLYMAPEQAAGRAIDARADLFSLGSVLYEMCTGRPAFRAGSTVAVVRRVCDEAPTPIRDVNPDVPEPLCRVIDRLHAKCPADRYGSATEVARVLTDLLARSNHGLLQPPAGPVAPSSGASPPARRRAIPRRGRSMAAAAAAVVAASLGALGAGEATGVTDVRGTVIRLFSTGGTLVLDVDDPGVSVAVDGADVVITGAGAKEIRLKPGSYTVRASKDGRLVRQELVAVTRNGRQVVRVSKEAERPHVPADVWERSVAALTATQQVQAVARRLRELNPGFDGLVSHTIVGGKVVQLTFLTDAVDDISAVRALADLAELHCPGDNDKVGKLSDLSPLHGMKLNKLRVDRNPVSDLSDLRGMPLAELSFSITRVADLTPVRGMPLKSLWLEATAVTTLAPLAGMKLEHLHLAHTSVADLSPVRGMPLHYLHCGGTPVADLRPLSGMPLRTLAIYRTRVGDLTPLEGMPLKQLNMSTTAVTDLAPLKGLPVTDVVIDDLRPDRDAAVLRTIPTLQTINDKPVAEFWKNFDGK